MRCLILCLVVLAGCTRAEDNGFLTGCGEAPGPVDLTGECYPIIWPTTPLTVAVEPGHEEEVERAMREWERQVDRDLFKRVAWEPTADVLVTINECCSDTVLGATSFYIQPDGSMTSDVRTFNAPTAAQLDCVLFHELGHVLGLAHDDYGPMRYGACGETCDPGDLACDDFPSLTDVRVTDGDRRRLREVY